jgi:hypothetical protein
MRARCRWTALPKRMASRNPCRIATQWSREVAGMTRPPEAGWPASATRRRPVGETARWTSGRRSMAERTRMTWVIGVAFGEWLPPEIMPANKQRRQKQPNRGCDFKPRPGKPPFGRALPDALILLNPGSACGVPSDGPWECLTDGGYSRQFGKRVT